MAEAWIGGAEAPLEQAIGAAARILSESRCAVIAGLGTDIAGAEAAIALARRIGGAFDHLHSSAALRNLDVMREGGWVVTSMQQARVLADLVLLVGPGLTASWRLLSERMRLDAAPALATDRPRRVIRLCPGRESTAPALREASVGTIGVKPEELPVLLGLARAQLAGRRTGNVGRQKKPLSDLVDALRNARYGVAIWSAADLDALSIEMLCGLIDDLNARTRFAGLPLPPEDNAAGVAQAAAWCTGFPLRVGFGRGEPEHDPWRFDAVRMVESGEADAAVWISACSPETPAWQRRVPLIALVTEGTRFAVPPEVVITVGQPGIDHDAVMFDAHLGVLTARTASAAQPTTRVAHVVGRIAEALAVAASC
jgi:formylmethanofuran dehydrogenase subunit B